MSGPDPKRRKELKQLAKELQQREQQRLNAVRDAGFRVPDTDPTWADRYKAGLTREIDRETGEIVFDSGQRVHRGLSQNEFLLSELGREAKPRCPEAANAASFLLDRQAIGGAAVCVWLYFQNAGLRVVGLSLVEDPPAGDWLSGRVAAHDRWLDGLLGKPPYDFSWGAVRSECDRKEVEAWISVSYRYRRPASPAPVEPPVRDPGAT